MLGVTGWALGSLWLWEGSYEGPFLQGKSYSLIITPPPTHPVRLDQGE